MTRRGRRRAVELRVAGPGYVPPSKPWHVGKRKPRPPVETTPAEPLYLITPAEAATRLGLDQVSDNPELTVRRMARRGELRQVRVSKWTMICPVSVARWIQAHDGKVSEDGDGESAEGQDIERA